MSEINPIENGVQQAYQEIRDSMRMILLWNFQRDTDTVERSLRELDDVVSNNWDELMFFFWQGVKQDVEMMGESGYSCLDCAATFYQRQDMNDHINKRHPEGYGMGVKDV